MSRKAGIKGKQPSVQEGSFLLFLRSVGYKEELPPSTIAWLEDAPVFKFLASRLSSDNFVSAEDQQEYNEIMLAKGPNPELYEALGDSGSDDGDELEQQRTKETFLEGNDNPEELQQHVQAWEKHVQQLEQQIASLRAVAGRVDSSVRTTRSKQTMYLALQGQAHTQLHAAKAELAKLNTEVNEVVAGLADVCSQLAELLQNCPQQWLLTAADLSEYQQQDEVARQVFERAMTLLNAAGVVRQLDPTTSPAPTAPAAAADTQQHPDGTPKRPTGFQSALTTPRHHKPPSQQQQQQQQQGLLLLTPRGRGKTHRAGALLDADIKRHTDQEARNAALLRELMRQRLAFKMVFDNLVKAEVAEAGLKHQLAAARDVHQKSGGFARYRSQGPAAVSQLSQEVVQLEERRQLLACEEVPALTEDIARLNDTYIVAGDYDRQLHKMAVATERKQAVLQSLLDTTSRHLLLLMLGNQEKQRLLALRQELEQATGYLHGHVDAINTRISRCVAAQQTLQQSQLRSNLQPDDSYLITLMAAADGSLAADTAQGPDQQQQQQQQQEGGAGEPSTPLEGARAGAGRQMTPQTARTPGYMPVKHLTDHLRQLSTSAAQSSSQLTQLIAGLPKHLDDQAAMDKQLYELAYPPGQPCAPLVTKEQSLQGSHHGSSSQWGPGSVIGSSAAPSLRSRSVRSASSSAASGSALGHHLQLPLLRLPEVAEQQASLEKANRQLVAEIQRIVTTLEHTRKMQLQRQQETDLERKAPSWFYTCPDRLASYVAQIREEVEALQMAERVQ